MFAVLLAATTMGDPNSNPVLHERLVNRMVAAVRSAAVRHPQRSGSLLAQATFIQLDIEIRQVGVITREEESAFELNTISSYMQLQHSANELADPVLDLELLATQPPLMWALAEGCWRRHRRQACGSLQGLAAWHAYWRDARPAVARVVGYTAAVAASTP